MRRRVFLALAVCACGPESLEAFHERCGFDEWTSRPGEDVKRRVVPAIAPTGRYARTGPHDFVFAGPEEDYAATSHAFYAATAKKFDRADVAMCAISPAHPEKLDPYQIQILIWQWKGSGRPDLMVTGKIGANKIAWGPQTRNVAFFTQRGTFASGDVIDLDVGDEDIRGVEHIGHVKGKLTDTSSVVLGDGKVAVERKFWSEADWEASRKAALAKLESNVKTAREIPAGETWVPRSLTEQCTADLAAYHVWGKRDDEDSTRAKAAIHGAANAWWNARMNEIDARQRTRVPAGQWRTIDRDFEARIPGLACYVGTRGFLPHCELTIELRVRREGASACGVRDDKIPALKIHAIRDDGTEDTVHSWVYRAGRAISSLHDLDGLHAGEIVSVDYDVSQARAWDDGKLDVMTADAIPWPIPAIRVGAIELRVY